MPPTPIHTRRWFQFGIWRIFYSMTLVCLGFALVAWINAPLEPQTSSVVVLATVVLLAAIGALFGRTTLGVCVGIVMAVILAVIAELLGARP
jgi:uncharacterized membrane protein